MNGFITASQIREAHGCRNAADRLWTALLCTISLIILFSALGSAGLFEPDEGRNAEKAREILLTGDWVTPLQNFIPTLDKPIAFYWLVALSFKVFGVSEWSARLPSVLSAVGCLLLVYRFARTQYGIWAARWSSLVLLSSIEFFILARIVIFDMTLTFFITLALYSFHTATDEGRYRARTFHSLLMYMAMAAGTLVKGPIALAIPAMVICCYLALARKWTVLRRLHLPFGILLFFVIVAPWYLWVDARNPGYLRYFLWEEHVLRFLTPRFSRSQSWYYFFGVLAVGFLPWTFTLPLTIKAAWRRGLDQTNIFLLVWTVLPFAFFSLSNAKLPHYILPVFPALALLTGRAITERLVTEMDGKWLYPLLSVLASLVLYLACGVLWPTLLATQIRETVLQKSFVIGLYSGACLIVIGALIACELRGIWRGPKPMYLSLSIGLALFFAIVGQLIVAASSRRSSKELSEEIARLVRPADRVVFYSTYLEGLPFYLQIDRPIWLVQSPEKSDVMGSFYIGEQRPATSSNYGPILFTFEQFAEEWKRNTQTFRVLLKQKYLARLSSDTGAAPKVLVTFKEYILVSNR